MRSFNRNSSIGSVKPPIGWDSLLISLSSTTLFLVARPGPTVFTVSDEQGGIHKVIIGSPHQCSCLQKNKKSNNPNRHSSLSTDLSENTNNSTSSSTVTAVSDNASSSTADNTPPVHNQSVNEKWCKHLLFCLIKVLKVPKDHPLCYQTSLTDSEVSQVLNGLQKDANINNSNRNRLIRSAKLKEKVEVIDDQMTNFVQRQLISDVPDENSCPICQDVMTIENQNLTWCRTGCGNNIHSKCMLQYCQFKISSKQTPCCPLCRDEWNMDLLKEDCKKKVKQNNNNNNNNDINDKYKCVPLHCLNCTCLLRSNQFYRCLECSFKSLKSIRKVTTDYCNECFIRITNDRFESNISSIHANHHFVSADASVENIKEVDWESYKYPICNVTTTTTYNRDLIRNIEEAVTSRELSVNDYDLLLQLDNNNQNNNLTLDRLLIDSLQNFKSKTNNNKNNICWCNGSNYDLTNPLKLLSCGHVCHSKCIIDIINPIVSNDDIPNGNSLANVRCCHENCNKKIFLPLFRGKLKPIVNTSDNNNNTSSNSVSNINTHIGNNSSSIFPVDFNIVGNGLGIASSSSREVDSDVSSRVGSQSAGGIVRNKVSTRLSVMRREQTALGNTNNEQFISNRTGDMGDFNGLMNNRSVGLPSLVSPQNNYNSKSSSSSYASRVPMRNRARLKGMNDYNDVQSSETTLMPIVSSLLKSDNDIAMINDGNNMLSFNHSYKSHYSNNNNNNNSNNRKVRDKTIKKKISEELSDRIVLDNPIFVTKYRTNNDYSQESTNLNNIRLPPFAPNNNNNNNNNNRSPPNRNKVKVMSHNGQLIKGFASKFIFDNSNSNDNNNSSIESLLNINHYDRT